MEYKMNILITGAAGFIGNALCRKLSNCIEVIGLDTMERPAWASGIEWEQVDLTDTDSVTAICEKYTPDVVIHSAGIAHQKIGAVGSATYMRVNSEATENLAKAAAQANPDVCFVFFSSVSVYGEGPHLSGIRSAVTSEFHGAEINPPITPVPSFRAIRQAKIPQIKRTRANNDDRVGEESDCWPSSDYAVSKLDAERRLRALYDEGKLRNLIILRLAPVYDREWSLNLDRRVFAPRKVAYLRFGSGSQQMSALARPNLVEFIEFLIHRLTQNNADEDNLCNQSNLWINVCDVEPYEFNKIIRVFKRSGIHPNRPVISVPLLAVWIATRIAGVFFPKKREWIHSCYDKLASNLVFDNERMMETGYRTVHSLESVYSSCDSL